MEIAPSLGYILLYVDDVAASLDFYERAFGLRRRFFHDEEGKAYGELETGATRLAFVSTLQVADHISGEVTLAGPERPPLGFEVALVTTNVEALYARSVEAGARSVTRPEEKPWGQTVAYVRDNAGFLVEICSPMG